MQWELIIHILYEGVHPFEEAALIREVDDLEVYPHKRSRVLVREVPVCLRNSVRIYRGVQLGEVFTKRSSSCRGVLVSEVSVSRSVEKQVFTLEGWSSLTVSAKLRVVHPGKLLVLEELCQGIFIYFYDRQNYFHVEGNLKIIVS